jgi:hypothetical protein
MKDLPYPFKINPEVPFHLESLPVFGTEERIDFFYKYTRASENLYIGNVAKSELLLNDVEWLADSIKDYISNKHFFNPDIVTNFEKRLLPKICWLTDSFFKKGFIHPICVHYNPRIQHNVVHPGSVRNCVIKLFQETPLVNCLYFNTGGVAPTFIDQLTPVHKDYLMSFKDTIEIELVADHGSIIPHINLDTSPTKTSIMQWQEFIYRRLTSPTFKVWTNHQIDPLENWYASKEDANIEIIINRDQPVDMNAMICKCVILAILGKSYASPSLTVVNKLPFSTPA